MKYIYLLCLLIWSTSSFSAQYALVIGIDQYKNQEKLSGSVNDAILIEQALRNIQIQPKVLLNEQATYHNVLQAWDTMVRQAKPNDTLIFTYAGHGGQIEDIAPIDENETDKLDETLILYDGCLTDDKLLDMAIKANKNNLLFVIDSCHAGGFKSFSRPLSTEGMCRGRGIVGCPIIPEDISTLGDGKEQREYSHITAIKAEEADITKICEYTFNNEAHGALSWFFAQSLTDSRADQDNNGSLERYELSDYLIKSIEEHTNRQQRPKLSPRADDKTVIQLKFASTEIKPTTFTPDDSLDIAVKVEGGNLPSGLKHIRKVEEGFDLHFEIANKKETIVYNNTGDIIAVLSNDRIKEWQRLIDKKRLLKALTQLDMRFRPVNISLEEGNGVHRRDEVLHFTIEPTDVEENLYALTLFNLSGNGELQFLYPLEKLRHSSKLRYFPYKLKAFRVVPPFGEDNLIAILCKEPPRRLQALLTGSEPYIPDPKQMIEALKDSECQVGQYPLITAK